MTILFIILTMFRFYISHPDLAKPQRLKYDPVGWDTLGKTVKRDMKWHGVFFEYTPKLKFIKDGKNLVHYFYEKYGIEAELILIINKYNPVTRVYEHDYTGRFNLTTINISTLYAECNIEQTGFLQKLKNRQDVKVDLKSLITQGGKAITPNTNETVDVELHSKALKKLLNHLTTNQTIFPNSGTPEVSVNPMNVNDDYYSIISLDEITVNEFQYVPTSQLPQAGFFDYPTQITQDNVVSDLKYNFLAFEAGSYSIDLRIKIMLKDPSGDVEGGFSAEWFIAYGPQDSLTTISLGLDSGVSGGVLVPSYFIYDKSLVHNFTMDVGDRLYIYGKVRRPSVGSTDKWTVMGKVNDCKINLTGLTIIPATTRPLFLQHESLSRIIESITDEPDSFRSAYYGRTDSEPTAYPEDGGGSLRGLASGKIIRGFPLAGNSTHINLKDAIESCLAIDGVGIGIETTGNKQRVRMEQLNYFYSPVRVAQFPYVKDIEKSVADDFIYNELEAGYDKWANEELNNLDEFNTKREFTLPITQIKKRLILKAPWSASGYTIEFLRRDPYKEGTNKDNDRDNDNFVIQLRRESGELVTDKDEDFAELNNLISPETVYNAKLSVMRNIKRNGPYIRSGLYHQDDKFVKLAFGEGNTAFTSRLTSETEVLDETTIAVEDLGQALWLPEIYKFKHKPTRTELEAITANPYGIIEFSATNKNWKKGWLLEQQPDAKSGLISYLLLRANV